MPVSTKKELYLAKNMGQLNEMSELPATMKSNNTRALVKTAEKMLKEAERCDVLNDEERAYVLYMKYFNVVSYLKKTADYKKQKAYYDDLLGTKNLLSSIDKAEKLSANLKQRYDQVEAEAVASKLASLDSEVEKAGRADVKNQDEVVKKQVTEISEDSLKETKEPETKPSSTGQITCTQLYTLLQDNSCEIILMDIRSIEDYQESRINHRNMINVPTETIKPGTTVTYIEKALPMDSLSLWKQRGNIDHIILLDWNSTQSKVKVGTPLNSLKDALFKYDSTVIIKSEPLILDGGYEQWLLHYPMMCVNPDFNKLTKVVSTTSQAGLLDFDYPDFDATFTKPTKPSSGPNTTESPSTLNGSLNGESSGNLPRVDRTTKPKIDRSTKKNVTTIEVSAHKKPSSTLYPNVDTISANQSKVYKNIDSRTMIGSNSSGTKSESHTGDVGLKNRLESGTNLSNISNELTKELSDLDRLKKEKEMELEKMANEHERIRQEAESRLEKLKEEEQRLSRLADLRKKEQKDVADLMRMKRTLQQNITEEQSKNDQDEKQKQQEEEMRRVELERISVEEEKKKQRQDEVNRLRMERKKKEEDTVEHQHIMETQERQHEEAERQRELAKAEEKARLQKLEEEKEKSRKLKLQEELDTKEKSRQQRYEEDKAKEEAEQLRQERLRQEQEFKKQMEIERQAKLEKQRQLEEIERIEKEKQEQLRLERERLERERRDREKRQREEEDRKKAEEAKRIADEKIRLMNESRSMPKIVPSPNLKVGWEKRLEPKTNRYFYINHNEGKTQWEPPVVQGQESSGTYTTKLQDEPKQRKRGLSRSNSSPNIAQLLEEEENKAVKPPTVNRASKPVHIPEPLQQPVKMRPKRRDFNPIHGNVGRALTGLRNLGNTCYMNSTIQCLNNTSPLVTYLLSDMYLYDINIEYDYGSSAEVADDFAHVVKVLWSGGYRYITPRDFKSVVGRHQPMFSGYDQQDSQEFLTFLMDALHEGLNKVKKKPAIPEQDNDRLSDIQAAEIAWANHKLQNESIIVELFQGQLKSTVRCLTCGKRSNTFQAFMYLSLPIPPSSRCKLQDCLRQFSMDEKMTGSNRWMCPSCKCKRDAARKIEIWKLPRILLIALNRFVYEGQWRNKISTNVDFQTSDLDLTPYVQVRPTKSYQLYAVSNHFGSLDGGHYTACCKNPVTKKWYKYDDHEVFETSESSVKTSAAYVLYYTSVDLPPPQFKQNFR